MKDCSSHNQALIECYITDNWSKVLSAETFCSASFIAMGQHFVRLVESVQPYVHDHYSCHLDETKEFINMHELRSYALDNCALFERYTNTTSAAKFKNKNTQSESSGREIALVWDQLVNSVKISTDGWYYPIYGVGSLHAIGDELISEK